MDNCGFCGEELCENCLACHNEECGDATSECDDTFESDESFEDDDLDDEGEDEDWL